MGRPGRDVRARRDRDALPLRPLPLVLVPARARRARRVDDDRRPGRAHDQAPLRDARLADHLPSPVAAHERRLDRRPHLGRPGRAGDGRRLERARARGFRVPVSTAARAARAPRRADRDRAPALDRGARHVRGQALPPRRLPGAPEAGAGPAPAAPRRRPREARHRDPRRALRRRVQRDRLVARGLRRRTQGARRGVRARRTRPEDPAHVGHDRLPARRRRERPAREGARVDGALGLGDVTGGSGGTCTRTRHRRHAGAAGRRARPARGGRRRARDAAAHPPRRPRDGRAARPRGRREAATGPVHAGGQAVCARSQPGGLPRGAAASTACWRTGGRRSEGAAPEQSRNQDRVAAIEPTMRRRRRRSCLTRSPSRQRGAQAGRFSATDTSRSRISSTSPPRSSRRGSSDSDSSPNTRSKSGVVR